MVLKFLEPTVLSLRPSCLVDRHAEGARDEVNRLFARLCLGRQNRASPTTRRSRNGSREQATGTRDEHYNLISVLYHALHGAANCEIYMADAEAADRGELVAFFREAQAMHAALDEQAKRHLGIGGTHPREITQGGPAGGAAVGSGVLTSGDALGDVPPGSADVQRRKQPVDDVLDEPPDASSPEDVSPTTGASPGTRPPTDENIVAETGGVDPDTSPAGDDAAPLTGNARKAVPPDAPRTQDPPPRTGDAPPSPSEQPTR